MGDKMEKKKKTNWFKIVMIFFFVAYISLYILNLSGYYDGSIRRKIEFTEGQILEFEEDIKNGKNVEVTDYLEDQNKDYTNGASKLGYTISKNVDAFLNRGIKDIISILGRILS